MDKENSIPILAPPLPSLGSSTSTNSTGATTTTNPIVYVPFPPVPPTATTTIPHIQDIQDTEIQKDKKKEYNDPLSRAGLPPKPRLIVLSGVGSFWGFGIGAFLGGKQSGLQYLAENAHRLPTTVQGWYFYHKTKNYRVMLGGVQRGMKYAVKTGGLCLLYGGIEAGLDEIRGEADIVNSVTAGVTTGALFSVITKLSRGSFRYSLAFGAVFGLVTGGLSDLHRYASGDSPKYINWLTKNAGKN
ncbi:hypothetical protein BJ944DRAFT_165295 [Cunninghamella echinulata]|nr:hypothetical protein BJ944DRAFT_165295 [Cunninghamella echinulata]